MLYYITGGKQAMNTHPCIHLNQYTPTLMRCHKMTKLTSDHPATTTQRKKGLSSSISLIWTAAAYFPSWLNVYSGRHGGGVILYLRGQWTKTAVNTFLSLPDWWMLSMQVMWVLLNPTEDTYLGCCGHQAGLKLQEFLKRWLILKSGCITHKRRSFADIIHSNFKHALTTWYENNGTSHTNKIIASEGSMLHPTSPLDVIS